MPRGSQAGASAHAQYRYLWARGRPRRLTARLLLAGAAFAAATWLLSWRAGIAAAVLVAAADTARKWHHHSAAAAWRKGARGERHTARILRRLEQHGYTVLHDRALPGSRANIDHLIIGPSGVWVVDSKAWHPATRITRRRGQIWVGQRPADRISAPLAYETRAVERALGCRLGAPVTVGALVAVHGPWLPRWRVWRTDGVPLLPARRVPGWIRRHPVEHLAHGDVERLAVLAEQVLAPKAPTGGPA